MSTLVLIGIIIVLTLIILSSANINNFNLHFFVIFASSSPSSDDVETTLSVDNLAGFSKISTRIFDHQFSANNKPGQSSVNFIRATFTTATQEATPLGIVKLHAALKAERFSEKSPSVRRRFVIIIGRGGAIQKAIVAVRAAFPSQSAETLRNPVTIFVYDEDFFNNANVVGSVYQLNQDRRTLIAPLLASTVLHKSNPKGGLVVLIHDLVLTGDQLFIAAHSLFNTLVLVTEDLSEDVVCSNLRNEIAPVLGNILLSQTIPAATFVVHVANSRSIAKIFSAANRIHLLSNKYVWIISDKTTFIASSRRSSSKKEGAGVGEIYLKQPVKPYLVPQNLIALEMDRKQLFDAALTRLLNGLAKSLAANLSRLKANMSQRLWYRFLMMRASTAVGFFPANKQLDVSFAHLFEPDGSVLSGDWRGGGGRYYSDDAKFVTAVQIIVEQSGQLRIDKVSLRNVMHTSTFPATHYYNINFNYTTLPGPTQQPEIKAVAPKKMAINNGTVPSSAPLDALSDLVITDGGATDDVIPHLLQVYISLGPPFVFEKPLSQLTGECQGPSVVVCDIITPGVVEQLLPTQSPHRCCSGLVPDLVRSLSKDLKVNARILVSAVGSDTIANTTMALADPYLGHRSSLYYVTDSFFTSSYAMLVAIRRKEPSLLSFLSPFPYSVWIGIIFFLAPVTAVSISQFEWRSPFGLNPWGRRRSTNYTLGSALNMVYALLFGHTVRTKCPKAWPSKWTQNFWAGFAIFVIASYTGNLASFLAKRYESVEYDSIYDLANSDHKSKVGIIQYDPILTWLRLAVSGLTKNLVVVPTLEEATRRLRQGEFEVVIGELATLRYWQITDDATACSTKLLPRTFADRELAPAMLVDSQFRAMVAGKMREYKMMGEFEQLVNKNRFVSLSLQGGGTACGIDQSNGVTIGGADWARQAADTQLTLSHANGLFLAMVCAIVACFFILIIEHLTNYWVVPKLRDKKRTSFWRSFTMMYLSQRLYRILNSEEVLTPTQVIKEMVEVIKRLDFSRIFQKSARKKRFRKITIAEFVQQVKDEKDKTLPDIVVQTKGIHRAKKAWKSPHKSGLAHQASSVTTTESIDESMIGPAATRYRKSIISIPPPPDPEKLAPGMPRRMRLHSVQHELVSSSSTSLNSLPKTAAVELQAKKQLKKPPAKIDYSRSYNVHNKRVSFQAGKTETRHTMSDGADKTNKPSTSADEAAKHRICSRPPALATISDITPAMRWKWLREQIELQNAKTRRTTMLTVYKDEMNKLVAGRTRLEQTVTELCRQLEQIKRERDRLLIVQELEQASSV